jgi:alditol oxidase
VEDPSSSRDNWAGNVTYRAGTLHLPRSVDDVRSIVRAARRLRPLGTRHSFNDIADTDGDQISLAEVEPRLAIDPAARTVTVDAGQRYGDLSAALDTAGFALPNLASLPHISIAGACATGTHGSGQGNGILATAVTEIELVTADGEVRTFRRGDESFPAAATSLGALGVVSALTLAIEPAFQIAQEVYEDLPIGVALESIDDILGSGYSVSLFTEWREPVIDQIWRKVRVGVDDEQLPDVLAGARPATVDRHPIRGVPAENCTPQLGVGGPWHERLPHFRLDHTPSSGDELQSEVFVALEDARAALEALLPLRESISGVVQVTEIRSIAADDIWLSPAYGRDSFAIHFTWQPRPEAVLAVMREIDRVLRPFDARPHWGKVISMSPDEVRARYQHLPAFVELARSFDPKGTFRNAFLDRFVFGAD